MKSIDELNLPEDVRYTNDHEWARKEKDVIRIGIDDYAQDQLGEVVFVELPEPGTQLAKGEEFGTVESVKAVAELFMPMGGEVLAINPALADSPQRVNDTPYGEGWMMDIKPADPKEWEGLMVRKDYIDMLKGEA